MNLRSNFRLGFVGLLTSSLFNLQAQQARENLPVQITKGKWMISHDVLTIAYYSEKDKTYDANKNLTGSKTNDKFYSALSLFSPSWGNMNFGAGKTHQRDANDVEFEEAKNSNWAVGITPSIGYFIQDRLLLGARVQFYVAGDKTTYTTTSGFQEYDYRYTTIGLGPEVRYYFGKNSRKRLFHAGLATNVIYRINRLNATTFANQTNITTKYGSSVKQPEFKIEPYLGSSWFAGKRWTFTGMLFFTASSLTDKLRVNDSNGLSRNETKSTRSDLGIRAGVNYTL